MWVFLLAEAFHDPQREVAEIHEIREADKAKDKPFIARWLW